MAAPPARARADYDYLIKLLLIGDSGELLVPFIRSAVAARSARDLIASVSCFCVPCDSAFRLGSGTRIGLCGWLLEI